jgi:RNA polymerase sigma factor (sigma-70 family)
MTDSHDTLLLSAIAGDEAALVSLLHHHESGLRLHVERAIHQKWNGYLTIDDVLQETFLDAFRLIRRFVPSTSAAFGRWLRCIADHKITDAIRAISSEDPEGGARRARFVLGADPEATLIRTVVGMHTQTSASGAFARREAGTLLHEALLAMPPEYRTVVEQYDLQHRPMTAVAEQLGKTVGAAHMTRARALERLGDLLAGKVPNCRSRP